MMNTMHTTLRTLTTAVLTVVLLAGCAAGGTTMPKDAAGRTQAEVSKLSLHQEYNAYGDHYTHMQQLLKDAQLQVHDGEWEWNGGDRLVLAGGNGVAPLEGSDTKNSYDMATSRLWSPPGATGAKRDLDPMIDYFESKGWKTSIRTIGDSHDVRGVTGDGWQVLYMVQPSGRYAIDVYSESFWTNDGDALSEAVGERNDSNYPDASLPGDYPAFPSWDSPIVSPPKFNP